MQITLGDVQSNQSSNLTVDLSNILANRFRGYFPVVLDVETGGFNAQTDALLEIALVMTIMDESGLLLPAESLHFHIEPFAGANIEKSALQFNGIDPYCALRQAVTEAEAMKTITKEVKRLQKANNCQRSVIVAHNAAFDQSFVNAAMERANIKRPPFHPFVSFDTTTLSGLALGQTVLAKACETAKIEFDNRQAHSALYDTQKTAELFCHIVNRWKSLGGWPLP